MCKTAEGARRRHDGGDLVDGLDDADFVVDRHDRNKRDSGVAGRLELVEVDQPVLARPDLAELGPAQAGPGTKGGKDGGVFEPRAHQCAGCSVEDHGGRSENGQVVGLRAAGGEDHLAEVGAQQFGDLLAGVVNGPAGPPCFSVAARRVAVVGGQVGRHGGGRLGPQGRGCRVVEIGRRRPPVKRSTPTSRCRTRADRGETARDRFPRP